MKLFRPVDRPRHYLFVLIPAAMIYIVCVLQRLSPPVVALDIGASLKLAPDELSAIFVATFIGYGLTQPLAGFWVDRFGPRRCLLLSALLMALSTAWFSFAGSFWTAALSRCLLGFAAGLAFIPCLRLSMNWLPARYFGLAASAMVAASSLANFMAGRPLALAAEGFGWRAPFLWLGFVTLALFALGYKLLRDRPETAPEGAPSESHAPPGFFSLARTFLSAPIFWLLGGLYIGADMIYLAFTGLWAGPYLIEVHKLDPVTVGNILSAAAFSFLIGPPLLALWGDRWGSYPKVLLVVAVFNTLFCAFIIWSPAKMPLWSLYVLCFVGPVGGQAAGLVLATMKDFFPKEIASSGMGFLNVCTILGGAVLQQVVGVILTPAAGAAAADPRALYGKAFMPMLAWGLVAAALAAALIRIHGRRPK